MKSALKNRAKSRNPLKSGQAFKGDQTIARLDRIASSQSPQIGSSVQSEGLGGCLRVQRRVAIPSNRVKRSKSTPGCGSARP